MDIKERALILGVDFDGTLCSNEWPNIGEPNRPLISQLKVLKRRGTQLILFTCREGQSLVDAVMWCKNQGLTFDAVNENTQHIKDLFAGDEGRKPYADIYIDDRAMSPDQAINTFGSLIQFHSDDDTEAT